MIDWFYSIMSWVSIHWRKIMLVFAGVDVVGIGGMLWTVFKQRKLLRNNTDANLQLGKNVKEVTELSNNVKSNTETVKSLNEQVILYKKENDALKENVAETNHKLDVVLEVMSVVYSKLKDENTRTTVTNIITNAKYAEQKTKAELQAEIDALKAKMNAEVEAFKKIVDQPVKDETENKTERDAVRY